MKKFLYFEKLTFYNLLINFRFYASRVTPVRHLCASRCGYVHLRTCVRVRYGFGLDLAAFERRPPYRHGALIRTL